jgi:hypothetical protein
MKFQRGLRLVAAGLGLAGALLALQARFDG